MSLNESAVEDAALPGFGEQGGERVKSEIGRVKSWGAFPISLFAIQSCPSAELSVAALRESMDEMDPMDTPKKPNPR
ncbi:MAG: hypothetical protein RLZZ179_643 [Verrucomicrobiota bacterium]|jgi:hypothetical protein